MEPVGRGSVLAILGLVRLGWIPLKIALLQGLDNVVAICTNTSHRAAVLPPVEAVLLENTIQGEEATNKAKTGCNYCIDAF